MKAPDLIWHYCPVESFRSIVESSAIWLSNAQWLNDQTEMAWGRRLISSALRRIADDATTDSYLVPYQSWNNTWPHVACFSTCKDSLPQWRAYADDGAGFALGIAPRTLGIPISFPERLFVRRSDDRGEVMSDWAVFCFPMIYDVRGQRREAAKAVQRFLDGRDPGKRVQGAPPDEKLQKDAFAMTMAFKSPYFHEEREYRIAYGHLDPARRFQGHERIGRLVRQPRNNQLRMYTPFSLAPSPSGESPIRVVRLGPKCKAGVAEVTRLLENNRICDARVQRSRAPYR